MASLSRELEQLQKLLRDSGRDEREPIYFCLHDWADAPTAFEQAEAEDAIGRLMPAALDRLIEAGKITERERGRVTFIVRTIIDPKQSITDPQPVIPETEYCIHWPITLI